MKSIKRLLYGWIEKKFLAGCTNFNSLKTRKRCRSKKLAREMFAENNIPHAGGEIFYGPVAPIRFAKRFNFPLVVKPNVGGFSRGSHFPINSMSQLLKAAIQVKIWWPSSVVEEYLEGANYRVLVAGDRILSIIRRYPPQVTGNGQATIEQLIDEENKIRAQMQLHPVITPIAKDRKTRNYLAKSGKSLETIPGKDEVVRLHNRIALTTGGVIETIDPQSVPKENLELFQKIPGLLEANLLGIDAIFEQGIETSYRNQKTIFLEVNSRPYIKMHDYPRYGVKDDFRAHLDTLAEISLNDRDIF